MAAKGTPHRHHDAAARIITKLRAFGLPQKNISDFLEWANSEGLIDLGDQGYSVDTLQRHYPLALEMGAMPSRQILLQNLHSIAIGDMVPEGVSKDAAYRAALDALKWTLEKVHGVGREPKAQIGETFPVELLAEVLSPDELLQLERIMVKLHRSRKPSEALIEHE